ncbi:MAG: hypothetical protein KDD62_10740, partial [Bdellovibrionales bacterium]|nr:hypothetical protein [Bdellovibrionales bacterium]
QLQPLLGTSAVTSEESQIPSNLQRLTLEPIDVSLERRQRIHSPSDHRIDDLVLPLESEVPLLQAHEMAVANEEPVVEAPLSTLPRANMATAPVTEIAPLDVNPIPQALSAIETLRAVELEMRRAPLALTATRPDYVPFESPVVSIAESSPALRRQVFDSDQPKLENPLSETPLLRVQAPSPKLTTNAIEVPTLTASSQPEPLPEPVRLEMIRAAQSTLGAEAHLEPPELSNLLTSPLDLQLTRREFESANPEITPAPVQDLARSQRPLLTPTLEPIAIPELSTAPSTVASLPTEIALEMERAATALPLDLPLRQPTEEPLLPPLELQPITRRHFQEPRTQPEMPQPSRLRVPHLTPKLASSVDTNRALEEDLEQILSRKPKNDPRPRYTPRPHPQLHPSRQKQKVSQETATMPKPRRTRRGNEGGLGDNHTRRYDTAYKTFDRPPTLLEIRELTWAKEEDVYLGKHYRRKIGKKSAWQGGEDDEVFDFERVFEWDREDF